MEKIKISELKFAEYNPRKISKFDFDNLKRSIQEFGFVEPVVVNRNPERFNIVIGGNQRVKVAKELGIKEVPAVFVNLPLEKEKILNLALNRISGVWDGNKLIKEIKNLINENIDLSLSGFSEEEIKSILENIEKGTKEIADSIFKLEGTEYESKIPEGLEYHSNPPNIKGILKINEKVPLTFVFDNEEEMIYVRDFFVKPNESKVPNGKKLLYVVEFCKRNNFYI